MSIQKIFFYITALLLTTFYAMLCSLFSISFLSAQENSSTSVGGYGEMHINVPEGTRQKEIDFHRFIFYLSHTFNEKISFFSELEIEHAGKKAELEQAFIQYQFSRQFGLRAGVLIQPLGIINLYHEPPLFHGVERPNFEKSIIPTTWWENGVGVYGTLSEELQFTAQITAGLTAEKFTAKDGIRGGRQKAIESKLDNPSFAGNIVYLPQPELKLGLGTFFGNTVNDSVRRSKNIRGFLFLGIGHAQYTFGNLALKAEYAFISLGDADSIAKLFSSNIAKGMNGFLLEAAYDVLPHLVESEEQLWAFGRIEKINTQASMPAGSTAKQEYNRTEWTFGLTYKPVMNVAFKTDVQYFANAKNSGAFRNYMQWNLGIGYNFF